MPSSIPPTTALPCLLRSCGTWEGGRGAAALSGWVGSRLGGQQAQVCKVQRQQLGEDRRAAGMCSCSPVATLHCHTQWQAVTSPRTHPAGQLGSRLSRLGLRDVWRHGARRSCVAGRRLLVLLRARLLRSIGVVGCGQKR